MKDQLHMQKQNKGFSLVELIIAIAILVIVTGAVCSFIVITSRNYANGNNDIGVQQEAQLAFNQISDVVIDARNSINYAGEDGSGNFVKVLKDSEFANTPEVKKLIVYNTLTEESEGKTPDPSASSVPAASASPSISPGTVTADLYNYIFMWQKSDESLYFAKWKQEETEPVSISDFEVLAEHINDFQVDLSQVEERRVVKLMMNFTVGTRGFQMANNVTVRNQVVINEADIQPLDKEISVEISIRENGLIMEPGEKYQFASPQIKSMNAKNKEIEWAFTYDGGKTILDKTTGGSEFIDKKNGMLKVGIDEGKDGKPSEFEIVVIIKATNGDKSKEAQSLPIKVQIKRVTTVTLHKMSEKLPDSNDSTPGAMEVMQGSTVILGGTVDGVKLGSKCDSCGEDPTGDRCLTGWTVVSGSGLLQNGIQDSDHETATIQIKADAAVGSTITIRAVSDLSSRRPYGPVQGEITLKVVEKKNPINPFDGILKHGDQTRVENIVFQGFDTRVDAHALVVHIVDNSTGQVVAYAVCMTQGWNIWLSPDYFNLDLKKSYTFYLQGLESVSKQEHERYDKDHGTMHKSSIDTIGAEYDSHSSPTAPFAYTGDMFKASQVFSTILEPVQLTYGYNSKKYCAQEITFNTTNVLSVSNYPSDGLNILDKLKFYKDEASNIDINAFTVDDVKYSIYKGSGNDAANWSALRVYKQGAYQGSDSLYNGNVQVGTASGLPTIKVQRNNLSDVVGTYHVVPGIWYNPKAKIGNIPKEVYPTGYQFPVYSASMEYVEFPENTFHVTVTAEGTMDITSDRFTGSVCFPLPAEMKNNTIFTNLQNTEWQDANIQDRNNGDSFNTVDSSGNLSSIRFNRIRYRYIQSENAYEVEPMWETFKDGGLKLGYSYGIYKCPANGSKWECRQGAQETNNITLEFKKDGATWSAHVPLPTDDDFMFTKGSTERQSKTNYTIKGYKRGSYNESKELNNKVLYCDYDAATGEYKLTLVTDEQTQGIVTTIRIAGVYTWKPGNTKWDQKQGEGTLTENIGNIRFTLDGKTYDALVELPTSDQFMFTKGQTTQQIKTGVQITGYNEQNSNESRSIECKVIYCDYDAQTQGYKLSFAGKTEINGITQNTEYLGDYTWKPGDTRWTKVKGTYTESKNIANTNISWNGEKYVAYVPLPSSDDFWYKWGYSNPDWGHGNLQLYKHSDLNSSITADCTYIRVSEVQETGTYTLQMIKVDYSNGSKENVIFKVQCSKTGTAWTQVK